MELYATDLVRIMCVETAQFVWVGLSVTRAAKQHFTGKFSVLLFHVLQLLNIWRRNEFQILKLKGGYKS
jgi:hypothetical protein